MMVDYLVKTLNIFSEGASRTASSQSSLNDPERTELQSSMIKLQSFDDALKTLTDSLQHLRSAMARHHNTLLPISRLPNDLLIEIFAIASEMKYQFIGIDNGNRRHMLETLVCVCQEWREIVHNTPSLWAHIHSNNPHMFSLESLARSGEVPLHISFFDLDNTVYEDYAVYEDFKMKIFREVHRWKSIEMSAVNWELLKELEQQSAPLLEKLVVWGDRKTEAGTLNLFRGSASRLRHLTLGDITIPWESNLLSGLRTLSISRSQGDCPSAQQVMHILQSCPDLTSFNLRLPEIHPGPILLEHSAVELPRLEYLSINIHPLMADHLLQRMRIPSCKIFDIGQYGATKPIFSAAMKHLIPSLSSILLAACRVNIRITPNVLEYKATTEIDEDDDEEEEDGDLVQRIHIQVFGDGLANDSAWETLSWLVDNVHTPSFSSPVSLEIRGITSPHVFTHIIDGLSSATKLDLSLTNISSIETIVSHLGEPSKTIVDGNTTPRWPLPNLKELSFRWCSKDLEPTVVMRCIQRRAGHGFSLEGMLEDPEKLPTRLTKLSFPRGSSTTEVMRMFPDCMEWCGLELDEEDSDEEIGRGVHHGFIIDSDDD
ncbi:hypothetical protein FRB95_010206 [Tulasnella sp. JGI-2019a]|nr:hypothetical protein FRB95_010206 [Tulasnella sp. JGI-2019a]